MDALKKLLQDNDTVLWAMTFVGVCVLVGMGKLESEAVKYMMMAIVGRAAAGRKTTEKSDA